MASSPSGKTHRLRPLEGLNLTPFIDMITCLMFFLLMFAGVIPIAIIDAPLPKVASSAEEIKQAKENENKFELTVFINNGGFRIKTDAGDHSIPKGGDGKFDYPALHNYLVTVHQRRPKAREITLMPTDDIAYDVMIGVMDAARELSKGDAGFQTVPPDMANNAERVLLNRLFPDVSIVGV